MDKLFGKKFNNRFNKKKSVNFSKIRKISINKVLDEFCLIIRVLLLLNFKIKP